MLAEIVKLWAPLATMPMSPVWVTTVTSAVPLSPAHLQQLNESLRSVLGSAKVSIDARVEPEILGGLVVKVGSRLFDSSIRSKLQRLQLAMKGVA